MNNYALTQWYVEALTGSANTVIDWRCIHDKDKGLQGVNVRGTLKDVYTQLMKYNEDGYGIFCNINQMDGHGSEYANVQHIRTQVVDLDNPLTAEANYGRAGSGTFAVQSSPGKFHVYWRVQPYTGNDYFTNTQRKFAQLYDGDKSIIDATRVMRVPGFMHLKSDPFEVTAWLLSGQIYTPAQLDQMLAAVNIVEHINTRNPLGSADMSAPSLEYVQAVMRVVDPNQMDRLEWLSFSAAIKQAAWLHADEETIYQMWSDWCGQYGENDDAENRKLWGSIKDTEVGWKSMLYKAPTVKAHMDFGYTEAPKPMKPKPPSADQTATPPSAAEREHDFGEILSEYECQQYFENCFYVERMGEIFSPTGRFMNATKFNGRYGGKQFIISSTGKTTDEPWKAALRSTVWTVPKVDHVRFLPTHKPFEIIIDDMKRRGLNTYIPASIKMRDGDVSPFTNHVAKMLPDPRDQKIIFDYMAHCVKYPGHKIPWSPMIQSAQGTGKSAFSIIMSNAVGSMYVYNPNAQELVKSGSTFNAWMRGKIMIMVDEIRTDERLELVEILKPMISEPRVEIQAKGVDQDMEDNTANWFFFTNHKDAIPVTDDDRRYAIFYSALQSNGDIQAAGLTNDYFTKYFEWLKKEGGAEIVTKWLMDYPIERGAIPNRAPETTTQAAAVKLSRSPMEVAICDAITDGFPGFKGDYVSSAAVVSRCKAAGVRAPRIQTITQVLEKMGFVHLGRANQAYIQEDINNRSEIFGKLSSMTVDGYAAAQGYL